MPVCHTPEGRYKLFVSIEENIPKQSASLWDANKFDEAL